MAASPARGPGCWRETRGSAHVKGRAGRGENGLLEGRRDGERMRSATAHRGGGDVRGRRHVSEDLQLAEVLADETRREAGESGGVQTRSTSPWTPSLNIPPLLPSPTPLQVHPAFLCSMHHTPHAARHEGF